MSVDSPDLRGQVGEHANVLFLVSPFTPRSEEYCVDLLRDGRTPEAALVFVIATQTPDDRFETWRAHADESIPPRICFLDLGETVRSATRTVRAVADRDLRVETASSPGNLTEIGVHLSGVLSEWGAGDDEVAICFEPLSTMLQYSSVRTVFQFLHVLTRHVEAVDARAHFHLDPTAHDSMTINQLRTLFDAVVEVDGDAGVTVHTR